ncbi:uncharacterized protein LOC131218051 [Magnolia sinica]|uniref:uncharacterized protein LOC131218051 n=1 Tax=Magnolia sinica TaxID=86752 RepID=UPI00265A88A1|nr:uncharacterized protein LOC131218051 [Magnolia sinica]
MVPALISASTCSPAPMSWEKFTYGYEIRYLEMLGFAEWTIMDIYFSSSMGFLIRAAMARYRPTYADNDSPLFCLRVAKSALLKAMFKSYENLSMNAWESLSQVISTGVGVGIGVGSDAVVQKLAKPVTLLHGLPEKSWLPGIEWSWFELMPKQLSPEDHTWAASGGIPSTAGSSQTTADDSWTTVRLLRGAFHFHAFEEMCGYTNQDFQNLDGEVIDDCEEDEGQGMLEDSENGDNEKNFTVTKGCWLPIDENSFPRPKFSLQAVTDYIDPTKKAQKTEITLNVKLHLLAMGWKIAFKAYGKQPRYRYTSPDGSPFYSLHMVCTYLKEYERNSQNRSLCREKQTLNGIVEEERVVGISNHLPSGIKKRRSLGRRKRTSFHGIVEEERVVGISNHSPSGRKRVSSHGAAEERSIVCYDPHPLMKRQLERSEDLTIKSAFCPQAIIDYCMTFKNKDLNVDMQQVRLNAKKHLSSAGWKFWYVYRTTKQELRYCSPKGKIFCSLLTACKAWMENEGILYEFEDLTTSMEKESNQSTEMLCPEFGGSSFEPLCHQNASVVANDRQNGLAVAISCQQKLRHPLDCSDGSQILEKGKASQSLTEQDNKSECSYSKHLVRPPQKRPRSKHNARLCLLIDKGMVLPGQKVRYMHKNGHTAMAEGKITREGIECDCCRMVFALSRFEAHAKSANHRPAAHIFLEDGRSLLDCQMQIGHDNKLSGRKMNSTRSLLEGDSICSICHDGGDLVLCDHCPSCFHLNCIGLKELPEGEWFCPCCRCGICGQGEFNSDGEQYSEKTVIYCDQCEREYHVGCLRARGMKELDTCPRGNWFCSEKCSEVYVCLHELLGKSNSTCVEGVSWTLLRSREGNGSNLDMSDVEAMTGNSSKLYAALKVLHECFTPVIEPLTKRDLLTDVVFNRGSQLNRLNFQGFYTVLLEKADEPVAVATIRVFGGKVAEVPLICTLNQYRRQGMCRLVMNELEKMLSYMGVERLFLPAIPQTLETWTTAFGFTKMTGSERLEFLHHVFLEFQETVMCQKLLTVPATMKTVESAGNKDENLDGNNGRNEDMDCDDIISKLIQSINPYEPVSNNHKEVGTGEETTPVHFSSSGDHCSSSKAFIQETELTKQSKRAKQISVDARS